MMRAFTRFLAFHTLLAATLLAFEGKAQKSIPNTANPVIIDFSNYTAAGFDPNPSAGQLDSYTWSVTGFSDGDILFGGSGSSGDFARGTSNGGVGTGGIYAFDNGTTGRMLGVQPIASDFTPGTFRLKLANNTGDTLYGLDIGYSVWTYNDENRSNAIDLAYSMDNSSYTTLSSLTVESPEAASGSPAWKENKRDSMLNGIKISPGDSIYLRWRGTYVSGSDSRDEFGIDEISVQGMGAVTAGFSISPNDTVCQGSFMTFEDSSHAQNDSIVSYAWDFGNGDTAFGDTVTYSYSDSGLFNVQLLVTTQSGAKDSITHTILSDTVGDPSFNYDTTSYCTAGTDPTPTITGDAAGTFSEGTGGLSIDTVTGMIDLSASSPGDYKVFYETDGDCPNSATFEMEVVDQYDATIDSVGQLCSSLDTVIDLTAPQEGGTWSGTGVVNDSTGGFNPNVAGVDTHQVIHDIGGSCGDADTIDIVVDSTSDATIDSVGKYCVPSVTDVLSAAQSGGVWSGPGIIDSSTGEFSPNNAGTGTHTITYEIKGGCYAIDSIDIEVDSSKNATIHPLASYCENSDTVNMSAVDSGGTWSGSGVVDSLEGKFLPDSAGPGTHYMVYQIDGECGNIDSESVTVFDSPEGEIDSTGPYCVLAPADTLTAVDTVGDVWSGPGIIDSADGVFHPDTAGAGLHQIVHSFPNDSCGISDTMMIRVNGVPDASIDTAGPFCINGDTTMLTAADSGGTWSGPGITNPQTGAFLPSDAGSGTHELHYEIQNAGSCADKDSIMLQVQGAADASIDTAGPFCIKEDTSMLSAADSGGTWSGPGITNPQTGAFLPSDAGSGTHELHYEVQNAGSCADKDSMMIRVYGVPDASIDSTGPYCINGGTSKLSAADSGGTWSGPGITDPQSGAFLPSDAGLGTHKIHYEVQRVGSCTDKDSMMIEVVSAPSAGFTYSKDGFIVDFTDTSSASTGYYWEFGDGDSENTQSPIHTYSQKKQYTACQFVYDDQGCSDTVCKTIDLRNVSVQERQEVGKGLTLRPNPASKQVELRFSRSFRSEGLGSIELMDLQGRILRKEQLSAKNEKSFRWQVSDLAPGTYFIRVLSEKGIAQRKFVVR